MPVEGFVYGDLMHFERKLGSRTNFLLEVLVGSR